MRTSRKDFLKLIGLGPGAIAALMRPAKSEPIPDPVRIDSGDPRIPEPIAGRSLYMGNRLDVVDGRLYDRIRFIPGERLPHRFHAFSDAIGISGKTLADTNMQRSCTLPAPMAFFIRRIHFIVPRNTYLEDLRTLQAHGWDLRIGQKSYGKGSLFSDLSMADIDEALKTPTNLRTTIQYDIDNGLAIENQMYFTMEFEGPLDHECYVIRGIDFMVMFEGLEVRGVQ